jgi:putative metal binding uncharacterized protein
LIGVLAKVAVVVNKTASKALFDTEVEAIPQELLDLRGWTINSKEYPILNVSFSNGTRSGRVMMVCDDWNELPPSIRFLDNAGQDLAAVSRDPAGVINVGPHPITGRPFICHPGSREYHTHSSHTGDLWDNYKDESGFDLGGILTKVWHAWRKS